MTAEGTRGLYDRDIRALLHEHLAPRKAAGTLVVDEMAVFYGDVRVDVAAIDDVRLAGWEIKSDRDSLARLPHQVEIYGYVFDEMTVVVGDAYARTIADHVPAWWSIARAGEHGLEILRQGGPNRNQQAHYLAGLLWRAELAALLEEAGLARGYRGKPRWILCQRAHEALSLDAVRSGVLSALRSRADWPACRVPPAARKKIP